MPRLLVTAALLLAPLACVDAPTPAGEGQPSAAGPAAPATASTTAPAESTPAAAKPGSTELSAEELELIAADPKTLTPEQNRKRGYALRKKVMQDPDSPTAKELEEVRQAALAGQISPEQMAPPAAGAADPGLVIELPEHLAQPPAEAE